MVNKKGIIRFSKKLSKDIPLMALLFAKVTPLKFDLDYYSGGYYMLCESDDFEEVKEGERIPQYDVTIKMNEAGVYEISDITKFNY